MYNDISLPGLYVGITKQSLRLLLEDDNVSPIAGNFLSIGHNTVVIDPSTLSSLLQEYSKEFNPQWFVDPNNIDSQTRSSKRISHACVKQEVLLKSLFPEITSFSILDYSDYEGADLIFDLNEHHHGKLDAPLYDYIFDGSVLDNVFNPANALINLHKLLAVNGRIAASNCSSFYTGAMSTLSCEWFYGFFACNNYTNINTFLYCISDLEYNISNYSWSADWFLWTPSYTPCSTWNPLQGANHFSKRYISAHVLVSARKTEHSSLTQIRNPQNLQYCFDESDNWSSLQTDPTIRFANAFKDPSKVVEFSHEPLYLTDHYEYVCTY